MTVTVRWNGIAHVEDATETPGDGMTIGEYCAAFVDAHGIDADRNPRITDADGATLPADSPVDLLDGEAVFVTVDPLPEPEARPALDAAGNPVVVDNDGAVSGVGAANARPLGRHLEHDDASRAFPAERAAALKSAKHKRTRKPFDQGDLGSCTGNAMCGVLVTQPWKHSKFSERTAVELYELATTLDNVAGAYPPDDTGSSGLAVCKAAQQLKYISAYHHAFGLDHALAALVLAPVIIGINWYDSFDTPGAGGLIEIADGAQVRGGHEVELLEIDVDRQIVRGPNSWGPDWADHGYFEMSFETLGRLLSEGGDCTVPVP